MISKFNFPRYLLILLLVLTLGIISTPKQTEAVTVKLQNPYNQKMNVALVYFDDSTSQWIVRGWYNVAAGTTRNLNFPSAVSKDSVWIHAHTSEASWGGSGDTPRRYTVVGEAFKYVAGQAAPAGSNRRQVSFDRLYVDNYGVATFDP